MLTSTPDASLAIQAASFLRTSPSDVVLLPEGPDGAHKVTNRT